MIRMTRQGNLGSRFLRTTYLDEQIQKTQGEIARLQELLTTLQNKKFAADNELAEVLSGVNANDADEFVPYNQSTDLALKLWFESCDKSPMTTSVILSDTDVTIEGLRFLSNQKGIRNLAIVGVLDEDDDLSILPEVLMGFQLESISASPFTFTPEVTRALSKMPELRAITVSSTMSTRGRERPNVQTLDLLGQFPALVELDCDCWKVDTRVLEKLGKLKLSKLTLLWDDIKGHVSAELHRLRTLTHLHLTYVKEQEEGFETHRDFIRSNLPEGCELTTD